VASFAIPTFNLTAGIWHDRAEWSFANPAPDAVAPCNLANGRVAHVFNAQDRTVNRQKLAASASFLFPKNTDIRDASQVSNPDVVEVPLGSGRYYWITFWDDIALGFPNEHRWAIGSKIYAGVFPGVYRWPVPAVLDVPTE